MKKNIVGGQLAAAAGALSASLKPKTGAISSNGPVPQPGKLNGKVSSSQPSKGKDKIASPINQQLMAKSANNKNVISANKNN